jgi:hypothetical protein
MSERALWQLGDEELLAALVEGETAFRRVYGHQLELVGELVARNVTVVRGYRSPVQLLQDLLRVSRVEAQRRVGQAEAVTAVPTVTGPVLPAPLPVAAQAVAEGAIGAEHLEVVRRVVKELPPDLTPATRQIVEQTLVQAARVVDPVAVAQLGRTLLARLDQDGQPPRDDAPPRSGNELRWTSRRDGGLDLKGRPTVVVSTRLDTLRDQLGAALLGDTALIPPWLARRLACDCGIIPAVLGSANEPLDLGRKTRTVPTALRRALILRDRGCAFHLPFDVDGRGSGQAPTNPLLRVCSNGVATNGCAASRHHPTAVMPGYYEIVSFRAERGWVVATSRAAAG